MKQLGVAALIAESFAGLFYRNSLNLGLPAVVCKEAKRIRDGDRLEIDFEQGVVATPREGLPSSRYRRISCRWCATAASFLTWRND